VRLSLRPALLALGLSLVFVAVPYAASAGSRYRGVLIGEGYEMSLKLRGRVSKKDGLFVGRLRCKGKLCLAKRAKFRQVPSSYGFRGNAVFKRDRLRCFLDGFFTTGCTFGSGHSFDAADPLDLICGHLACYDIYDNENETELAIFGFALQR